MDLEGVLLSEVSQREKEKYHMISLICRLLKKTEKKSEQSKQKEACKSRVQSSSYQKGRGGYRGKNG